MSRVQRAVIVGGGGAGDAAAFALRQEGFDGEVEIISADSDRPYDRPYLSKEFLRGEVDLAGLYLHEQSEYDHQRIGLRLAQRVVGASPGERRLFLEDGGQVGFDHLVVATGGTPRWLSGAPRVDNVFTLRSLRDSKALGEALQQASRILVVGAGFIGAEVAASARLMGKQVVLVEAAKVPLSLALGEPLGTVYAELHRAHGVELRTGTMVADWHLVAGRVTGVTLGDGSKEDVDLALLAVGIDPNVEMAKSLGLTMGSAGIATDQALLAAPGVYCIGDIAEQQHPLFGRRLRLEHWEVAKGHGRSVAASIVGSPKVHAEVPYFWSDQYDVTLEYRGHAAPGFDLVWRGDRHSFNFTAFYLNDGLVNAALSLNDSATNEAAQGLIESRQRVSAEFLADPDGDIQEWLGRQ